MPAQTIHLVGLPLDQTGHTVRALYGYQEGGKTYVMFDITMPQADATQETLTAELVRLQTTYDRIAALEEALTPRVAMANNLRVVH